MNDLAIDILFDYMLHVLKVKDGTELLEAVDKLENLLPNDRFLELEPYVTDLISAAEKQGFTRAIQIFVNNQVKTSDPIV